MHRTGRSGSTSVAFFPDVQPTSSLAVQRRMAVLTFGSARRSRAAPTKRFLAVQYYGLPHEERRAGIVAGAGGAPDVGRVRLSGNRRMLIRDYQDPLPDILLLQYVSM